MGTQELLENEFKQWLSEDDLKILEGKIFDYEQLITAVGKFVHTIPRYAASGIARYGINITKEPDQSVELDNLAHVAYFCHAKCNKIIGEMPRIFQVDNVHSCEGVGLEYYCKMCHTLLGEQLHV